VVEIDVEFSLKSEIVSTGNVFKIYRAREVFPVVVQVTSTHRTSSWHSSLKCGKRLNEDILA
jgi:hypothetical protein